MTASTPAAGTNRLRAPANPDRDRGGAAAEHGAAPVTVGFGRRGVSAVAINDSLAAIASTAKDFRTSQGPLDEGA